MRTFRELTDLRVVEQQTIARRKVTTRWVADDRGRVATLNSHPVALWAHGFDQPIKEIIDLGFICIDERRKSVVLALNTCIVKQETLAGAFFWLAQAWPGRIIICLDCGTDACCYTVVTELNDAYRLIEAMVASASPDIALIASRLETRTRRIRYARPRSVTFGLCSLQFTGSQQLVHA